MILLLLRGPLGTSPGWSSLLLTPRLVPVAPSVPHPLWILVPLPSPLRISLLPGAAAPSLGAATPTCGSQPQPRLELLLLHRVSEIVSRPRRHLCRGYQLEPSGLVPTALLDADLEGLLTLSDDVERRQRATGAHEIGDHGESPHLSRGPQTDCAFWVRDEVRCRKIPLHDGRQDTGSCHPQRIFACSLNEVLLHPLERLLCEPPGALPSELEESPVPSDSVIAVAIAFAPARRA